MKRIARVFPRRTAATPDDALAFTGPPDAAVEADEVHVSVTWTWDLPKAEWLAEQWKHVAPVKSGGPATGERGGMFVPGMYLKHGYTITSRGCPNRCWFCSVPKREGNIRELPIFSGWNVLDDNLLACSETHIRAVFAMLNGQKPRPQLTGGLEAKRLRPWMVHELCKLKPKLAQIFCAYDTPDDLDPLRIAGKMLREAGFTIKSRIPRCYVLCGWRGDTFHAAELRMWQTIVAGFLPMAMLYRDAKGERDPQWAHFQREWARVPIICAKLKARGII